MDWLTVQYPARTQPVGSPADWVEPVFFDGWMQPISEPVRGIPYRHTLPSTFFIGDPADFGPPIVLADTGWFQPTTQPVYPVEYRYHLPAVSRQIEPSDFIEPVFFDGWFRLPEVPVRPKWQDTAQDWAAHVINPDDFVTVLPDLGWLRETNQDAPRGVPYVHRLPSVFEQIEPGDFVAPIFLADWVQPISEPVRPIEYRYTLPDLFRPDYEPIISSPDLVNLRGWLPPIAQPVRPVEYRYMMPSWFAEIDVASITAGQFVRALTVELIDDTRVVREIVDRREVRLV